jgi:hypothetical protein
VYGIDSKLGAEKWNAFVECFQTRTRKLAREDIDEETLTPHSPVLDPGRYLINDLHCTVNWGKQSE